MQFSGAFALLGPFESWQVDELGYGEPLYPGDLGGPHNLGEEFRWNTPVLFYSYDGSFLDYFGSNGVVAVDQAMAVFNGLTNVSSYSAGLTEFPLESKRVNHRALALGLRDLKSTAMQLVLEEMAVAQAERFTWTLRVRSSPPNTECPVFVYLVAKRNFDPVTLEPSAYVNGTLYSYQIIEYCPADIDAADAEEFGVDPLSDTFTSVSSKSITAGQFYTGLTRDDVGALRYMLRTNNMNFEAPPPGSVQLSGFVGNVDPSQQFLLISSNLSLLIQQARTNNAAALQALYPGLQIVSTTIGFTNMPVATPFAYFTNYPTSPAGFPATLVVGTTWTTNVMTVYNHTFGNVITNSYFTNSTVSILTTNIVTPPYAPAGTFAIEVSLKTVTTNVPSGDFFLLPTNFCGASILYTQFVSVVATTNVQVVSVVPDGVVGAPTDLEFSRSIVTYFTNHYVVANPIICAGSGTNNSILRQGIERVRFIRRDYDSLLGQFFTTVETNFTAYAVNNSQITPQEFRRTVTAPDFLFLAEDLTGDPTAWPILVGIAERTIAFGPVAPGNLAGPGIMDLPITITFNKVGPYVLNVGPAFVTEASGTRGFVYGSFDGTTNAPIVYPNGRSIFSMEMQVFMQITTTSLPSGTVGFAYSGGGVQLTGSGGTPPYTWSIAAGSAGLPPGLSLSSSGVLSGVPMQAGVYDFALRMTDVGSRSVEMLFTLTINP